MWPDALAGADGDDGLNEFAVVRLEALGGVGIEVLAIWQFFEAEKHDVPGAFASYSVIEIHR